MCCAAPALAFIQLAHQAARQGVGGARRNDEGLQKGGIPTLINALVNGEVAPKPAIREAAIELPGSTRSGHSLCPRINSRGFYPTFLSALSGAHHAADDKSGDTQFARISGLAGDELLTG